MKVHGRGLRGLQAPADRLDAGNSGSTIRMLSGVLAGQPFSSIIFGDESLSRRPMKRIMTPLEKMGARIDAVAALDSAMHQALLLADIERRAEARLIAAAESTAADLKTDVLLVPHHGSATSSSAEFIAATRPQLALVSAGYRNRFRHPRAEVVQRWQQAGAQVLRTDEEGALQVQFGPVGLQWQRQRSLRQRYWY